MSHSRGHKDDFAALTTANIDLAGKIALAKYGGPFRGVKVRNAEAHGMIGVVMFSDPGDDGPQEAKGQVAYPSMTSIAPCLSYVRIANLEQMVQHASLPPSNEGPLHPSISTPVIQQLPDTRQSPASSVSVTHQIFPRFHLYLSPTAMRYPF